MKRKSISYVLFRLFDGNTPKGFERWNCQTEINEFTVGDPTKEIGHLGYEWTDTCIRSNKKEILHIDYV